MFIIVGGSNDVEEKFVVGDLVFQEVVVAKVLELA